MKKSLSKKLVVKKSPNKHIKKRVLRKLVCSIPPSRLHSIIVESSNDAIVGVNFKDQIILWNKGAQQIFDYSEKEALGKSFFIITPKKYRKEHKQVLMEVKKKKHVFCDESVCQRKDKSLVEVSFCVSLIKDKTKKVIGMSFIVRDISKSKKNDSVHVKKMSR